MYIHESVSCDLAHLQYDLIREYPRMFPPLGLQVLLFTPILIISSALIIPTDNALWSPIQPLTHSNLTLPGPAQKLSDPAPPIVHCDSTTYKRDLVKASCINAISTIPDDADVLTIGDRTQGSYDIPLPFRYISCKALAPPVVTPKEAYCSREFMLTDHFSSRRALLL